MTEIKREVNNGVVEETFTVTKEEIQQRINGIDRRISHYNESIAKANEEKAEYEALLAGLGEE